MGMTLTKQDYSSECGDIEVVGRICKNKKLNFSFLGIHIGMQVNFSISKHSPFIQTPITCVVVGMAVSLMTCFVIAALQYNGFF